MVGDRFSYAVFAVRAVGSFRSLDSVEDRAKWDVVCSQLGEEAGPAVVQLVDDVDEVV